MKMIRAYLDIFKIRMGNRLKYDIIVDEGVEHLALPPMLIQPLVENSLTHGLEPLLDGGEITVHLFRQDDCLHIRVRDTGVGLQGSRPPGTGTASVMERIAFLYGERGRVEYAENQPHGLTVTIEIPQEVAGTSRPELTP
jgi:sensor histidine kinase YesM